MIQKLTYQLTEDIITASPPPVLHTKQGLDGKYYWQVATPSGAPTLRLLLLDHSAFLTAEAEQFIFSGAAANRASLQAYFSSVDLAYMRKQLPDAKQFKFQESKFQTPWVKVVSTDTILALRKRLGRRAEYFLSDSLISRYGSQHTYSISAALFSVNHRRALVVMSWPEGWATCIYQKVGSVWHKKYTLREVYD